MTGRLPQWLRRGIICLQAKWEWAVAVFLIGALVYAYFQFLRIGYLPLPFWPDPQDVYADGYSTAWWGFNGGIYDTWKSVYPPLSFVITRLFATSRCYDADVTFVRDCDWGLWWAELLFYALNAFIVYRTMRWARPEAAIPRTIGVILGLPMLYAFEHLNLLVFAYTGLFLAFSPLLKSARMRWLAFAIAINLKVYLVMILLAQLCKRRWRMVEGTLFCVVLVQLISYLIIGHGSPQEVYENIVIFNRDPGRASNVNFVFYATTYNSLAEFINGNFPVMKYVGSQLMETLTLIARSSVILVQAGGLLCFFLIWLHPERVSRTRLAALAYLFVISSTETGGYTTAGAVFFVFFEPGKGFARTLSLIAAYALCLAVDMNISPTGSHIVNGYFAGREVWQDLWISAGPFVRPGLILLMQVGMIIATLQDILGRNRHLHSEWPERSDGPALAKLPVPTA